MKKILIIGFMLLASVTSYASNEGTKIQMTLSRINGLTANKGIATKLEQFEMTKLYSYVQDLQKYEKQLDLSGLKTLYIARTLLHNDWLAQRDPELLVNEDTRRIKRLLRYMKSEEADYQNETKTGVDKERLVKDIKLHLFFGKEHDTWTTEDISIMNTLFEYKVNILENTAPNLRVASSDFEKEVIDAVFLQEMVLLNLGAKKIEVGTLDLKRLSDYSDRLKKIAYLVDPGVDAGVDEENVKSYRTSRYGKEGYLEKISDNFRILETITHIE